MNESIVARNSCQSMATPEEAYRRVIIDPLLTYVKSSMDGATNDSIIKACRDFYSTDEVKRAKELIWKFCDEKIIGTFPNRRLTDKNLDDVVEAMYKLDGAQQMPEFAVDSEGLRRIPRVSPEETYHISIAERVSKIEAKLDIIEDIESRLHEAEKLLRKASQPTYAATAAPRAASKPSSASQSKAPQARLSQNSKTAVPSTGMKLGGGQYNALSESQLSIVSAVSNASRPDYPDDGFQFTSYQKKALRKKSANAKQNRVTGIASSNKIKGAPEPSRDMFIYRVVKNTDVDAMTDYLAEKGIQAREVTKVSNAEAKFDSFRIEVPVSDVRAMLTPEFWPNGVCARRFYARKNDD